MSEYLSDAKLTENLTGVNGDGPRNAAPYFLKVPAADRVLVSLKANEISNTSPGWNYSGAVGEAVRQYLNSPEHFKAAYAERSARTREVQGWERRTGNTAPMSAFLGKPGSPII